MTGHQLSRRRFWPDLFGPVQQISTAIRTADGNIIAPDMVRDIRPRGLNLTVLLLIMGGLFVLDLANPGESFQPA